MPASSLQPLTGTKIVVVGCTGSGKSTLGEQLSRLLGYPLLHLDAVSHQPYFQDTPPEIFRDQVNKFIAANPHGWIIDGNYRSVLGHITWEAASDIIWLDYPIYVVLWRLLFRTIGRIRSGVKLWGMEGCVETWQAQFFSRGSLFLWVFRFYWKRRPAFYEELVEKKGQLESVNVIRFTWPSGTARWLEDVKKGE